MTDREERWLLLGVLASCEDRIDEAALAEALRAWGRDDSQQLRRIIRERGALTAEQFLLLEARVTQQFARPGGVEGGPLTDAGPGEAARASLTTRLGDGPGMAGAADFAVNVDPSGDPGSEPTLTFRRGAMGSGPAETGASGGDRYRILGLLAKGGLGEVYIARDEELDRHVALKLIRDRCALDGSSRARFLFEAGITSALEHPGIVPVHGRGLSPDGRPYYAMRLVKGEPLKDAIARFHGDHASGRDPRARTLGLRLLLRRFLDVCNVIEYAHSRGVLHRDLKPSNILLGPYGETLVVDWGLAKDLERGAHARPAPAPSAAGPEPDGGTRRAEPTTEIDPIRFVGSGIDDLDHSTLPGTTLGTPHYMSPEQAAGQTDRIGPAADVYGLGATLYSLLTGAAPCDGPDVSAILDKVRAGKILPPRQRRAWIPEALEAVCMKALATTPEGRYASPRELAVDLEHWLADEPVSIHRDPISVRLTRWGRRHRALSVAIGVFLVSAVVGLTVGTVLLGQANRRTEQQRNAAVKSARTLERQLYIHRVNLAHRECLENNVARAEELLALCPAHLRGWEWSYVARLCHQERASFLGHDECVNAVVFSPDGTRLVSGSGRPFNSPRGDEEAELVLWDAASGRPLRRFEGLKGSVHGAAFSPDGRLIASGSGFYDKAPEGEGRLTVWDAGTGAVVFEHREKYLNALGVAFSPDGRHLAAGFGLYSSRYPGHFLVFDVASGEVVLDRPLEGGGVNALAFHPDGRRLAVAGTAAIELWDFLGGEKLDELRGHEGWVYSVAFHPDGRRLASAGWDRTIRIWDLPSRAEVRSIQAHAGPVLAVAFSPDGSKLASAGDDGAVKLWEPASGRELTSLRGHVGLTGVLGVAFSPDGARLASAGGDRTVKLWDVTADRQMTFHGQKGWITSLCSPDGASVLSGSGDHTIARWDIETGRLLRKFEGHADWVLCLALSPDGKLLASGGADQRVRIWDLAGGRPPRVLQGHDTFVRGVAFSPDGRSLVSVGGENDDRAPRGEVIRWDLAGGGPPLTLIEDVGRVNAVAFSPDGRSLAVVIRGRDAPGPVPGKVVVFDWPACRERFTIVDPPERARERVTGPAGLALAFSPDGRRLAVDGSGGVVRIYDTRGRRLERELTGHTLEPVALAFSPDGRRLASAGYDKLIKIWDVSTGEELISLRGHAGGVVSLAFSPDGHRLVTGGIDWTARVWDARPLMASPAPDVPSR